MGCGSSTAAVVSEPVFESVQTSPGGEGTLKDQSNAVEPFTSFDGITKATDGNGLPELDQKFLSENRSKKSIVTGNSTPRGSFTQGMDNTSTAMLAANAGRVVSTHGIDELEDSTRKRKEDEEFIRGVSLKFLHRFLNTRKEEIGNLTTKDVVECIIKPETAELKSRYLLKIEEDLEDAAQNDLYYLHGEMTGKANMFVSHCWDYKFADLVETLARLEDKIFRKKLSEERGFTFNEKAKDIYIWLDIFCINQHDPSILCSPESTLRMRESVQEIGQTILVLTPFDRPKALQRTWCLYEVFIALHYGLPFEILLPEGEEKRLAEVDAKDFDYCEWGSEVNLDTSIASYTMDKEAMIEDILASHSKTTLQGVDELILSALRSWLAHKALQRLSTLDDQHHFGYADATDRDLDEEYTGPSGKGNMNSLMDLLNREGQLYAAETLCRGILEAEVVRMGPESHQALAAQRNLAVLFQRQGKLNEAQKQFEEVVKVRERVLGQTDPKTLASYMDLANVWMEKGQGYRSLEMHEEIVAKCKAKHGGDHKSTINAMQNQAEAMWKMYGKQAEAEAIYKESLEHMKNVYGVTHSRTLRSHNRLASLLLADGKRQQSEIIFTETRRWSLAIENDSITGDTEYNLGVLKEMNCQYDEALEHYKDAEAAYRAKFGEEDSRTNQCRRRVSFLLSA
mmetsp:Transcript_24372/g.29543  ORF Transcript_24372/g.29543 Transcript_24372/m.29543 type:complete len:682 (-) Transcript_24372:396-2441(-)|eukprot:CAMPEP_0197865826 /NCGR_PEP_ID=MMETSP1438-20131217/43881_1 /TAXON_ID=1461541 /ORGANISM="Pterosperma sp., Strain CCMP1384" /LENGTH=681 /DNA_ID=CAMNT_0043484339 /DNA_START=673 /DNA_END=2718 /DNA_ORIENTATION=-